MLSNIIKNKFFKNTILYTMGSMMTPLIGFIMLPIYTNYLVPSEYGVMTTVQSLVGMIQIFLLLSLNGAVTRFYYDFIDDHDKQKEYLGSIFFFVFLFSAMISLLMLIFSDAIGGFLFSSIPINPYYYYMIVLSWVSALLALPLALLRAQEKAGSFVLVNMIKAFTIMLLSIYFIIIKGFGVDSVLLSQIMVSIVVVIYLYAKHFYLLKLKMNFKLIKNSLIFSLPLLPHVASTWIINSSDRVVLEKFVTLDQIGIYALAVQVSMILSLFYVSVNNALVPRYTKLKKDNQHSQADRLLKIFLLIVIVFGVLAIPIGMLGAKFLSSNDYNDAIWLIPLLIIGQIIKGFYFIPAAKLFYIKKTKAIATSSTLAAIVNIFINISLIPFIGIYGAIVSTILAEILRLYFIQRACNKIETSIS